MGKVIKNGTYVIEDNTTANNRENKTEISLYKNVYGKDVYVSTSFTVYEKMRHFACYSNKWFVVDSDGIKHIFYSAEDAVKFAISMA
jgi:very-short-patch-repair endonuclease